MVTSTPKKKAESPPSRQPKISSFGVLAGVRRTLGPRGQSTGPTVEGVSPLHPAEAGGGGHGQDGAAGGAAHDDPGVGVRGAAGRGGESPGEEAQHAEAGEGGGEGGDVGGQGDGERGGRDGREAAGARGADEGGHGEEGGGAQGAPGMDSIMSSPLSPISDTPTRGVKRGTRSDSLIGQTSLAEEDPFEGDDDEEEEHPRRSKRRTNSSQMQEVEARIALIGSITEGNEVQVGEGYGLAPNIPGAGDHTARGERRRVEASLGAIQRRYQEPDTSMTWDHEQMQEEENDYFAENPIDENMGGHLEERMSSLEHGIRQLQQGHQQVQSQGQAQDRILQMLDGVQQQNEEIRKIIMEEKRKRDETDTDNDAIFRRHQVRMDLLQQGMNIIDGKRLENKQEADLRHEEVNRELAQVGQLLEGHHAQLREQRDQHQELQQRQQRVEQRGQVQADIIDQFSRMFERLADRVDELEANQRAAGAGMQAAGGAAAAAAGGGAATGVEADPVAVAMRKKFLREADDYFYCTIIFGFSGAINGGANIRRGEVEQLFRRNGLFEIWANCEKFYVNTHSQVRLTYSSEQAAFRAYNEAKRRLSRVRSAIRVDRLVPPAQVEKKKRLLRMGADLKRSHQIQSYEVSILGYDRVLKLRVWSRENGTRLLDVDNQTEQGETEAPQEEAEAPQERMEVENETERCPICQDDLNTRRIIVLKCGHAGHADCILKHMFETEPKCSVCNLHLEITPEDIECRKCKMRPHENFYISEIEVAPCGHLHKDRCFREFLCVFFEGEYDLENINIMLDSPQSLKCPECHSARSTVKAFHEKIGTLREDYQNIPAYQPLTIQQRLQRIANEGRAGGGQRAGVRADGRAGGAEGGHGAIGLNAWIANGGRAGGEERAGVRADERAGGVEGGHGDAGRAGSGGQRAGDREAGVGRAPSGDREARRGRGPSAHREPAAAGGGGRDGERARGAAQGPGRAAQRGQERGVRPAEARLRAGSVPAEARGRAGEAGRSSRERPRSEQGRGEVIREADEYDESL